MLHTPRSVRALALLAAACAADRAPARIGFVYGPAATGAGAVAQQVLDSATAAGAPPVRVAPVLLEGAGSPSSGVQIATTLAAMTGIVGVVGDASSREALLTAPIYADARLPTVVPTATSRRLRDAGPWVFTLAPDDSAEGEFIAAFVADHLRARAVTLFAVADEYGMGLRDATAAALERRGVALADRVTLPNVTDCETGRSAVEALVLASLQRSRPTVAVFAARTGETLCAVRVLAARRPGMRFVAGDGTVMPPEMLAQGGPAVDSLYAVAFWHPDQDPTRSAPFVSRFERVAGRPPHHGDALAYDAVMVLAEAVRAGARDGDAVRRYLTGLGTARPPYDGLTGAVTFGAAARRPLVMTRFSRAARRVVLVPTP